MTELLICVVCALCIDHHKWYWRMKKKKTRRSRKSLAGLKCQEVCDPDQTIQELDFDDSFFLFFMCVKPAMLRPFSVSFAQSSVCHSTNAFIVFYYAADNDDEYLGSPHHLHSPVRFSRQNISLEFLSLRCSPEGLFSLIHCTSVITHNHTL